MTSDMDARLDEQDRLIAELREEFDEIESHNAAQLKDIEAERGQIEKTVQEYAYEVAGRRGYEKIVGFVLAVGAALAIGVGVLFSFLGINELDKIESKVSEFDKNADAIEKRLDDEIAKFKSELDETIDDKIAIFFDRNESKIQVYSKNVDDMKRLVAVLTEAENKWKEISPAIQGLANYDQDTDLKGDYLTVFKKHQTSTIENTEDAGSRALEVGIVLRVTEHLKKAESDPNFPSQFTPTDVFNVAQIARGLERPDLEKQLVTAAYRLDNTSSTRAMYLQQQVRFGSANERNEAFAELMELVTKLTMDSPQIVISEAWNAAEDRRRYSDLIAAIDHRIAAHEHDPSVLLPSHAYAIKGIALQRRGRRGDLPIAMQNYVKAIEALSGEGTHTQWSDGTIRNTYTGVVELYKSGVDISAIRDATERSGVLPLMGAFQMFDVGAQPDDGSVNQQMLMELMRVLAEQEPEMKQSSADEKEQ